MKITNRRTAAETDIYEPGRRFKKVVLQFTATTAAFGICLLLMTLAFDAWVWEQDGHCGDAIIIHHLRDCR